MSKTVQDRREFLERGALVGAGLVAFAATACGDDPETTEDECEELPYTYPDQESSPVRLGFLIDLSRCKGCKACSVACKTENNVRLGVFRSSVIYGEVGSYPDVKRIAIPWICNHCAEPECLKRCPTAPIVGNLTFEDSGETATFWARATYQRPDGLVHIDQDRCVGCGYCVEDCPYGARFLDYSKTAGGDPAEVGMSITDPNPASKCTLCIHRLEKGLVTSCVNACPANARMVGNINDPDSDISKAIADAGERVTVLVPGAETEPQVYYIDLDEPDVYDDGRDIRDEALRQYETPGV